MDVYAVHSDVPVALASCRCLKKSHYIIFVLAIVVVVVFVAAVVVEVDEDVLQELHNEVQVYSALSLLQRKGTIPTGPTCPHKLRSKVPPRHGT